MSNQTKTISQILIILKQEFELLSNRFSTDEWKKFKFGLGGPFKDELPKLHNMAKEYDQILFNKFGIATENVSFKHLIVLCLKNDNSKKMYKNIDTFKRQIKRMGDINEGN